ncbi:MAG: leucine-rich repeat protein [Eubacterium sp.]|nr:leucine-rich repeat protein [Eubacterium sp.]
MNNNKRKLHLLLITAFALCFVLAVQIRVKAAASGKCGNDVTYTLDSQGTLTIQGKGRMDDYVRDYMSPWDDIGSKVKKIVVEKGVTHIGSRAFWTCENASSVTIADSVTSIGDYSFARCESLKTISLPAGVTEMGEYAFSDCTLLNHFTVPAGIKRIPTGCFDSCESLSDITIPESIETIGESSFLLCESLTGIRLPSGLKEIERCAFAASELKQISLPGNLTRIGDNAFDSCDNLTSVRIPDSVTFIDHHTFGNCEKLKSVVLSRNMDSIEEGTFEMCESLTDISIPDNIRKIDKEAFSTCESLTAISIPDSVTYLGADAFESCYALKTFRFPKNITTIEEGVLSDCWKLTEISMPERVDKIGDYAFANCESLKKISIPAEVTYLGEESFNGASSLTDIFYAGTRSEWESISGLSLACIRSKATIHCSDEDIYPIGVVFTLKYNGNGGKASAKSKKVTSGKTYGKLATASRKGYSFDGWYTESSNGTKVTKDSTVTLAFNTLYAHWKPVNYKISYRLNGGAQSIGSSNPDTYTITDSVSFDAPVRTGYRFGGWYKDKKLKKKASGISKGSVGNKTFYAKWNANTYTIVFKGNGSSKGKMKNLNMKYGKSKALSANKFSRTGYSFSGWATSENGPVEYKNKKKVNNLTTTHKDQITLFAIWKINSYKISYKYNGGHKVNEEDNPEIYTVNDEIILAAPEKEGYTFIGWYKDKKYKKKAAAVNAGSTGNKTFYAKWKKAPANTSNQ